VPHIFFFSYASEDWYQPGLDEFYDDLCKTVAPLAGYKYDDDNISFRDHKMRLGEEWKPAITKALHESAVLVCIVSPAYLSKEFCGQEFFIFDKRRRLELAEGATPPDVILPVIWAPIMRDYPKLLGDIQFDQAGMVKDYFKKGLCRLKLIDQSAYKACLVGFADAIVSAWWKNRVEDPFDEKVWTCAIPLGPAAQLGTPIPNAFATGDWQEAAGPDGWIEGPEVANFVFAAGVKKLMPQIRYGASPSEWQPYLPPSSTPIVDYARAAVRKRQFRFREIPISQIKVHLAEAKKRRNLTVLVADPPSLALKGLSPVSQHDTLAWEGSAVLLPCDDEQAWNNSQTAVENTFPKHMQLAGSAYPGRIKSAEEFERGLDLILGELHSSVLKAVTKDLPVTDTAPPRLAATPAPPTV
jgi:FxsC-like protein